MSSDPTPPQMQSVAVQWPLDQSLYPQLVNQFVLLDGLPLAEGTPDSTVYLSVGHFLPPIVFEPDDLERALAASGGRLTVQPLGTYAMTVGRLRELHETIGRHLATIDARAAQASS